jgi:hypothetical protein
MAHAHHKRSSRVAALLIALAATLAPAHVYAAPPTVGMECGPNQGSLWLPVPALAAAGGATVDADGCATSDGLASSFVRGILDRSLLISDVYFKATSTGPIRQRDRNASVIIGDVDLATWVADVRAGRHHVKKVLHGEAECASFARSQSEQEVLASCAARHGKDTTGFIVTILAPNTRICNLMVRFGGGGMPHELIKKCIHFSSLISVSIVANASLQRTRCAALCCCTASAARR